MSDLPEIYLKFFEGEGYVETFHKKDVRILWNAEKNYIKDLLVEEFKNPGDKQYLYKSYKFDVGNCMKGWEDFDLEDVMIKIFISYQVHNNMKKHILFELSKVKEWRPKLAIWLYRNFSK